MRVMFVAVSVQHKCAYAVLKGIEEHKAKGFKPHEVQGKARALADEHLKVQDVQFSFTIIFLRHNKGSLDW